MICKALGVLAVIFWTAEGSMAADAPVLRGTLCVAKEGSLLRVDAGCKPAQGVTVAVEPAGIDRQFLWVRDDHRQIAIGTIAKNTAAIDLGPKQLGTVTLALSGEKARGWPADVELHFKAAGQQGYDVALQNTAVTSLTSVGIRPGTYDPSITAGHHLRLHLHAVKVEPGEVTVLGALRLSAAPRLTATVTNAKGQPLPSAVVTNPEGKVLAAASIEGALTAELSDEIPPYVEIFADGFAPHHLPVEPQRPGDIELGQVVLRKGVTLAVSLDRSGIGAVPVRVSVLTRDRSRQLQEIVGRDLKPAETDTTFPPIEAGHYFLGVMGPTPLARHTEELHLPDDGKVERRVTVDPIAITGEVLIGTRRATGGQLGVQPEDGGWEVAVGVEKDGSFEAESWEKGVFSGYYVSDPARDGTVVSEELEATSSPAHWHIVISDRTISGRIFDKETREAIPGAALDKEYQTGHGGGSMGIVPVKADGSFALDGVEAGDYTLRANFESYMTATVHVHVSATDSARVVDIPLERGITVALSLVTPAGDPVAQATLIDGLGDGINPDHYHSSDGAGQVVLRLQPGDARTLYVVPREGSFAIADVRAADMAEGVRVVVPPAVGTIRIRAIAAGKPLARVMPLFRWNGRLVPPPVPRFFPFADPGKLGIWTDENGYAELKAMPAGVYEFFPARGQAEVAAVVRGTSTLTPVRVGFTGGSVEVLFDLDVR